MIGDLIKARRAAKGLSQVELALRIGSSQRQVSRWENGSDTMLPRRETLEKLGGALDISLAEFYAAAGVIEGSGDARAPYPLAPRLIVITTPLGPQEHDLDAVIRFVESKPDTAFQAELAEARGELDRTDYEAWIADIYAAWTSNGNLAVRARKRGHDGSHA